MTTRELKNQCIKESIAATRERRTDMVCRVFKVKVINNKLSTEKQNHINRLFLETKWFYNWALAQEDAFNINTAAKTVSVKFGDNFEDRDLEVLGSQMKQDIAEQIKSNIKGLATKKRRGEKVGRIKFKSYCNTIPLRQYDVTYRINFEKNLIYIQRLKKPIKGVDMYAATTTSGTFVTTSSTSTTGFFTNDTMGTYSFWYKPVIKAEFPKMNKLSQKSKYNKRI